MMKKIVFVLVFFLSPALLPAQTASVSDSPVDWVNALVGTAESFGDVYPVIGVPWGMNYWTPQTGSANSTRIYTYNAEKIRGFRQTHQPHVALGDFGMFSIMPVTQRLRITEEDRSCWYSHKYEICKPYYYQVYLGRYDVTTEMTSTARAAQFLFTFPETDSAFLIIDAFDRGSYVKVIPERREVIGYTTRYDFGKLKNFRNYFVLKFDKEFEFSGSSDGTAYVQGRHELEAAHALAVLNFKTAKGEKIGVKTASSFISFEQARTNLEREVGKDSFTQTRAKSRDAWNKQLGRIRILEGDVDQMRTFYSSLYRALVFPNKLYEINSGGDTLHWSPFNGTIRPGYMFAGTGFWDTFRALYPLLTLVYPEINIEMQKGLANAYKEGGWIPEWSTPGYGNVMLGTNSASVVAASYLKGLRGYDIETLYSGLIHTANNEAPGDAKGTFLGRAGVKYYKELGYVPDDIDLYGSVSRTLEYAYNDFSIYRLGQKLGKPEEELERYAKRARNYRNLFDSSTGFMRAKNRNGEFIKNFDPLKYGGGYVEANAWQYSWSVFHDVQGLIHLMGGRENFAQRLDSLFATPTFEMDTNYYGFPLIKMTQTFHMGQYSQSNEPAHHIPYLYSYAGEPWKTQYWVREAMDRLFDASPFGYPGDEDNGQMSAWYIFSALGFYPVCPVSEQYILGSPLFRKAVVYLPEGKQIVINAPGNKVKSRYVNALRVNNVQYDKNWISHGDMIKGMKLDFDMSSTPNKNRGIKRVDLPYSFSADTP